MFDIGWTEFFAIAVIALIVVGPKDLPTALRAVTRALRKARGLAREFQSGIDELVREADLDDIRKEVDKARRFDLADSVKKEVDPSGTLTSEFDPADFARDLKERVESGPPSRPNRTEADESGGADAGKAPAETARSEADAAPSDRKAAG